MREKTLKSPAGPAKCFMAALFAGLFFFCPNTHGASGGNDFFGWRLVDQARSGDNGSTATFQLEGLGKDEQVSDVIYKSFPRERRRRSSGIPEQPGFYRKKIATGQSRFRIYSGRTESIELWARIRRGDKFHYAQTVLTAFGQSGSSDPESERMESFPDWPSVHLLAEDNFYRAQAGAELTIRITPVPSSLSIFENRILMGKPTVNAEGIYRYAPPHEASLSRASFSAKKDLLFVADLPGGQDTQSHLSFYLPVYRAFYGQISYRGGLAILLSATLLALALIWYWNRRFPWR
jgi:hypothetical protein